MAAALSWRRDLSRKQPCIVSRSVQVIKSAVLSEDILCWMPRPLLADEVESGELVRLPLAVFDWRRNFRIYRRKKGLMTPSVSIFIQCMKRAGQTAGYELA